MLSSSRWRWSASSTCHFPTKSLEISGRFRTLSISCARRASAWPKSITTERAHDRSCRDEGTGMSTATISLGRHESVERLARRLAGDDEALLARFHAVRAFSRTIRSSEYHVTNACNIRCRGCWFFAFDFDKQTKDQTDLAALRAFIQRERARHINAALLIGGEPTLVPDHIMAFVEGMEYITISTNGLRPLPRDGFERVSVAITLFGGGPLDDQLRAIKPNGGTFTGCSIMWWDTN